MVRNRYFIHFLLALCIGLVPVLDAAAASAGHSDPMPMDCIDCDPGEFVHDGACENQDCSTIVQSCGSLTGASYLPVSSLVETSPITRVINPGRNHSGYRQNLTEPLYRPPIA